MKGWVTNEAGEYCRKRNFTICTI